MPDDASDNEKDILMEYRKVTGRNSGSSKSAIDYDIKRFTEMDPEQFIATTEQGELSEPFWNTVLVQRLDTSVFPIILDGTGENGITRIPVRTD